jgi:hypothetical protein
MTKAQYQERLERHMTDVRLNPSLVLFLDFDGVLHPDPPAHQNPPFCKAPQLEGWLQEHSQVVVVISSTWRLTRTMDQIKGYLPGWQERIVGSTPDMPADSYQRQGECEAWMRMNCQPWTPWLALDDRAWNFRPFEKRLVLTNRSTGLVTDDLIRLSQAANF